MNEHQQTALSHPGGPVWHASAAPLAGWPAERKFLRRMAFDALRGVGDADLGEWEEWSGRAYHIRRRLRPEEQALVGDAVDIRGTPEQEERYQAVKQYIPAHLQDWRE